MTEKNRIIDALGERKLLLPALVNAALAANDQMRASMRSRPPNVRS